MTDYPAFRPTHLLTIKVRKDEDGDLWYARHRAEENWLTGHGLSIESLTELPVEFVVGDRVVYKTARTDTKRTVHIIKSISGEYVWLEHTETGWHQTSRLSNLEHAE